MARDATGTAGASVAAVSGTARYKDVLGAPDVAPLLLASMLARLPFGIFALATVLYLSHERDSYAVAGVVDGAFGIGAALGVPVQSRWMDRFGQRRILLPLALLDVTCTGVLIALTEGGAPTAALVACGLAGGFCIPNIGSALRALWPELLRRRDELLSAAFALDSVAIEVLFTAGPLIAAAIVAAVSPIAALALSAACVLTGTALFVSRRPSRAWTPDPLAGTHGAMGALRSSGVRTLVLTTLPAGFCFGVVEISMPAFASGHGAPAWAGVILSVWAAASAVGGLLYGSRAWRTPLGSVYVRLALVLPLGFLPALLAGSVATMALLIIPAGLLIAPLGAAGNQLVSDLAPPGAVTEAYAWPVTALILGFSVGTSLGGTIVETLDWRACFLAASLAALLGGALVVARRGTLRTDVTPV